MFNSKKRLQEIEKAKKELEYQKQELQFIKDQMTDTSPKFDITYIYVVEKHGIKYLANLIVESFTGERGKVGKKDFALIVKGYKSTLVDIFTNEIIHEKISCEHLHRRELIEDDESYFDESYFITFTPIREVIPELLAYLDKQVPEYVLQQAYYRLNNVNVNSKILQKVKK